MTAGWIIVSGLGQTVLKGGGDVVIDEGGGRTMPLGVIAGACVGRDSPGLLLQKQQPSQFDLSRRGPSSFASVVGPNVSQH